MSHIGLTVSHLPTSCSFFLSALQPLGYRYVGQRGNQIGLGVEGGDGADFFLCQVGSEYVARIRGWMTCMKAVQGLPFC